MAVARWAAGALAAVLLALLAASTGSALLLALVVAAALVFLIVADRDMRRSGGVPILVYHSVSRDAGWLPWGDNISVRPETFRRHMEVLTRDGWNVLATRELVEARRATKSVAPRSVVLHFDDGYLDNFQVAAPILREFGYPATFFVSADFIDAGEAVRKHAGAAECGYMTAAEMRELDADRLFEIAAHGLDHSRIPVSDRQVARLDAGNWRLHAAYVWAFNPGSKARWFEATGPWPLRFGDPVLASNSALCGRWWRPEGQEGEAARDARVEESLRAARRTLEAILGRPVDLLCWPFDRMTDAARAAARRAGFTIVTGGRGENRAEEDPYLLSRVHVHDRAFGGGGLWLEELAFRAKLATMSGNFYATFAVALASTVRRRRFRRPGVHA